MAANLKHNLISLDTVTDAAFVVVILISLTVLFVRTVMEGGSGKGDHSVTMSFRDLRHS